MTYANDGVKTAYNNVRQKSTNPTLKVHYNNNTTNTKQNEDLKRIGKGSVCIARQTIEQIKK